MSEESVAANREYDLPEVHDDRPAEVQKMDYLRDQVIELTETVRLLIDKLPQGQTQTVIHKQQGMGTVGAVCATVCVMCALFLILGAIVFVPDIHDLKAWQDILRRDVARLQAQLPQQKEKVPSAP